jgi:hypothetical protein
MQRAGQPVAVSQTQTEMQTSEVPITMSRSARGKSRSTSLANRSGRLCVVSVREVTVRDLAKEDNVGLDQTATGTTRNLIGEDLTPNKVLTKVREERTKTV